MCDAAARVSSSQSSSSWKREADALLLSAQLRYDLPGKQEVRSQVRTAVRCGDVIQSDSVDPDI